MAIAKLHLCSRNIGRIMQPKISLSQISLSPSSLSIRSFPHSPSLCFSALSCPWWSNQIKHCKLESRSTRIVALDTAGNYIRKLSQGVIHPSQVKNKSQDAFGEMVDSEYEKVFHPRDDANIDSEPARKKPKLAGETKAQELYPKSTQQERKDGQDVLSIKVDQKYGCEDNIPASNDKTKSSQGVKRNYQDAIDEDEKANHPIVDASKNSEHDSKKIKTEGETRGQELYPISTQEERKDGVKVATGDFSVNVDLEIKGDGEYVMKMKRIIQSSNHDGSEEDELERAKKMAQNAALLLLHADVLREMGEKLLDQSRASLRSRVTSM